VAVGTLKFADLTTGIVWLQIDTDNLPDRSGTTIGAIARRNARSAKVCKRTDRQHTEPQAQGSCKPC
jgi:hypothetical protein